MRVSLIALMLSGCTAVGAIPNPACVLFCSADQTTVSQTK